VNPPFEARQTTSLISLAGVDDNRAIRLVLKRFCLTPDSTERVPKEMVVDFSALGRGALFFETGAFSEGEFTFCLKAGLVQSPVWSIKIGGCA